MIRISAIAFAVTVLCLATASPADAITLTNRDATDLRLKITEGGDEAATHEVVVAADEMLEGVCEEGCTIELDSGEQESFEGYEDVIIEDGGFVIVE